MQWCRSVLNDPTGTELTIDTAGSSAMTQWNIGYVVLSVVSPVNTESNTGVSTVFYNVFFSCGEDTEFFGMRKGFSNIGFYEEARKAQIPRAQGDGDGFFDLRSKFLEPFDPIIPAVMIMHGPYLNFGERYNNWLDFIHHKHYYETIVPTNSMEKEYRTSTGAGVRTDPLSLVLQMFLWFRGGIRYTFFNRDTNTPNYTIGASMSPSELTIQGTAEVYNTLAQMVTHGFMWQNTGIRPVLEVEAPYLNPGFVSTCYNDFPGVNDSEWRLRLNLWFQVAPTNTVNVIVNRSAADDMQLYVPFPLKKMSIVGLVPAIKKGSKIYLTREPQVMNNSKREEKEKYGREILKIPYI
jgi:hypothetical protein